VTARLRGGLVRVFEDHRSSLATALRREFRAVVDGLEIDGDELLQREASRVATLKIKAIEATRTWAELVERRRAGRGRRPSVRAVERAARRMALDDQSAAQAMAQLRELVGERQPLDIARAIQAAQEAGR
jgi:hypothetical protein